MIPACINWIVKTFYFGRVCRLSSGYTVLVWKFLWQLLVSIADNIILSTAQLLLWTVLACSYSWKTPRLGWQLNVEPHWLFFSVCVYVWMLLLQRRPAVARAVAEDVWQVLWEWSLPHRFGRKHIFCWIWRKELHICFFPCTQKVCVCFQSGIKILISHAF